MRDASAALDVGMFATIRELAAAFSRAERIFVDVPIGLPWKQAPVRPCDRLARAVLGRGRASSVFPVPCREALRAVTIGEARRINVAVLGRSLASQTWGICPKIVEVDAFLLRKPGRRGRLREIHPEVCFWALAGGHPMKHHKGTKAGRNERVNVLRHHEPAAETFLERVVAATRRQDLQVDDVLDAAAALFTAESSAGALAALAGDPSHDEMGLPMEIVYSDPGG